MFGLGKCGSWRKNTGLFQCLTGPPMSYVAHFNCNLKSESKKQGGLVRARLIPQSCLFACDCIHYIVPATIVLWSINICIALCHSCMQPVGMGWLACCLLLLKRRRAQLLFWHVLHLFQSCVTVEGCVQFSISFLHAPPIQLSVSFVSPRWGALQLHHIFGGI